LRKRSKGRAFGKEEGMPDTVATTFGFRFILRARFLRTDITAKLRMHFSRLITSND
jgi:hypothetical protein